MKLDINHGSNDKIIAFENDNLLKSETITLMQNERIVDLTNLKCDMAYVDINNGNGDIIENLNISNPTNGEIELPINSNLTRKDGFYDCELRLKSSNGYVKFTAFFSLIIKANVFNKIGNKILNNDSFSKIQEILNKADGYSKDIEDKLNTIKSLDNSNIEAKNNINVLTVNIKNASAINDNLVKNTATAEEKNTTLNNSLEEAKKYINGLDGSQNIPQIRMDLDTLQNGLKSNQELAYEGTNLKCENTLDGRIEDIVLEGMTYQNLILNSSQIKNKTYIGNSKQQMYPYKVLRKANTIYTLIAYVSKNTLDNSFSFLSWGRTTNGQPITLTSGLTGLIIKTFTTNDNVDEDCYMEVWKECSAGEIRIDYMMVLEGELKYIPSYFEGIKSVGEAEENKVNVLSCGKNVLDDKKFKNLNSYIIEDIYSGFLVAKGTTKDYYYNIKKIKEFPKDIGGYAIAFSETVNVNKPPYNYLMAINCNDGNIQFNSSGKLYTKELYATIWMQNKNEENFKKIMDCIEIVQIQEGKAVTEFEPYKSDKKELKLPFEDGLKGIPNGAKDLIYNKEDGCYVSQKIGKQIFDENSPLQFNKDSNGSYLSMPSKTRQCECICDKLKSTLDGSIDKNIYIVANTWVIINRDCNSLEEYKSWLKDNPITVYYELAEPIEYKISDTKLSLDTYNALTYVFSNNAISPNIKLKVASNLGSIIQQNARSINDIYKLIDEVLIPQITTNTADIAILKLK